MKFRRRQDRRDEKPSEFSGAMDRRRNPDRRKIHVSEFVSIFSGIPREVLDERLADCETEDVPPGVEILSRGDHNETLYLILSGLVRIHIGVADSDDFIERGPGECIGDMSIIDGKPVSASVVTHTQCRLLRIGKDEFWSLLAPIPGVVKNLLAILAERMRANNQIIVQRERERLELAHLYRDMQVARTIQADMLPSEFPLFRDHEEIDLFAIMEPAKEIGGDFYDAFFVGPRKLFFCIGDVSGKGLPAALFMVRSLTQVRAEALLDIPPEKILSSVNKKLCRNNEQGMFVTIFCGILDLATGVLVYANGGHNPPLTDVEPGRYDFIPMPQGCVAGMFENAPYHSATLALRPGQTLFLYTDGVTEAADRADRMFSEERLRETLAARSGGAVKAMVEDVRREVLGFVEDAAQSDDLTMLAIRCFF
jgi:sigma-B regulation protein RsbU (phosphoserine phosphatase)